MKTARGRFDGRGVRFGPSVADVVDAASAVRAPLLVGPVLRVDAQLAVLAGAPREGESVVYPVLRTYQADGICRLAEVPSGLPAGVELEAKRINGDDRGGHRLRRHLAVEFFLVRGALAVNEIAARPHNIRNEATFATRSGGLLTHWMRRRLAMPVPCFSQLSEGSAPVPGLREVQ